MPEVHVSIGGREFEVSCQEGEEHYLHSAAALIDAEASVLSAQIGRMPEARMLLMAGLMLADKTAGLEEKLNQANEKLVAQEQLLTEMRDRPAVTEPVAVIPPQIFETMAELAARAEALAAEVDEKIGA